MNLRWTRRYPDSVDNFDLRLLNPADLDKERLTKMLDAIENHTHRGLSLNNSSANEFRRFFAKPETPLKEHAYARLSNWFLTASGDKSSEVASYCEALWDELFACRPLERLTSSDRNHVVIPSEFASFWARLQQAQGDLPEAPAPRSQPAPQAPSLVEGERADLGSGPVIRATYVKDGIPVVVEGSPAAMATFLNH
jgi:hypothetical protein